MNWSESLAVLPLIAILRGIEPNEALDIATALCDTGFACVEVPLNSPQPLDSIRRIRSSLAHRLIVGAGTVLDATQVKAVADAGGQLVVSPNCDVSVISAAKDAQLISVPAFYSPSEAFQALAAGADALKLFPAEAGGLSMLKALRAVLPAGAAIFPVGGISPDNMNSYLQAGAAGFGIGSALYKPGMDASEVSRRAAAFVQGYRQSLAASK